MSTEETIQVWIDQTEPDRPYIVSRGVDGVHAPNTIAVRDNYADAMATAKRAAAETGLRIIDECDADEMAAAECIRQIAERRSR